MMIIIVVVVVVVVGVVVVAVVVVVITTIIIQMTHTKLCHVKVLGMRLIRKAHLAPGHHECAYMSFKPSERDGTWIELLLSDPAQVSACIELLRELCPLYNSDHAHSAM